jgi:hypothetical protein
MMEVIRNIQKMRAAHRSQANLKEKRDHRRDQLVAGTGGCMRLMIDFKEKMARPKGFEPLTPRFVVWCSIQLSYGRVTLWGQTLPPGVGGLQL